MIEFGEWVLYFNRWPIKAIFWLEWGSSTAGRAPLRFAETLTAVLKTR